jgi:hypothetical protein
MKYWHPHLPFGQHISVSTLVWLVIKVFLFKSLFFAALHLFKELCKSCLAIPLPCVLTLKSLSLILGISLDLSLVTIKFWLLKTLSQLQVWSGKVNAYWANVIISGTLSLWNRVIVFQRDGMLSTGYFADLTIVFTKLRWQKQSTHVLKKYQFMLWLHFDYTIFFSKYNTGTWLEVLTVKMYPKKKKYDKKSPFWVGNIAYHTPWYFSVISYTKRMVPVYDFNL